LPSRNTSNKCTLGMQVPSCITIWPWPLQMTWSLSHLQGKPASGWANLPVPP
jgi:hypothetical protein